MFKFSPLLHKSIVNAVNVNKKTQGVSSLNLKSIKGIFFCRKIRNETYKTKWKKKKQGCYDARQSTVHKPLRRNISGVIYCIFREQGKGFNKARSFKLRRLHSLSALFSRAKSLVQRLSCSSRLITSCINFWSCLTEICEDWAYIKYQIQLLDQQIKVGHRVGHMKGFSLDMHMRQQMSKTCSEQCDYN